MKNFTIGRVILWLLLVPLALSSCNNKMEEHYEVPDWLRGSAWEVLTERGDYSIFLKGADLAGFRQIMEGKNVLTVMAPDDAAFAIYLKEKGYSDISEMSKDQLKKLIGFHLLYYSYNKEKLVNFRPEGDQVSDEDKAVNAGLYYKFRTRSGDAPTVEIDRKTGRNVTVYHLERFLPVFSYMFFATKGIDAKTNYEFFYPNSKWTGSDGFNVSNASVKEYEIIADNGYIYTIDKVLEPLETIYTELAKRDNYSVFFNLYDGYSVYEHDPTLSAEYGKAIGVDSLYIHTHGKVLPSIALEWPVPFYQFVGVLSYVSYSLFAPSNNALNSFFDRFWAKGNYESLEDVDPLIMKYLLGQYVYASSLIFPEQISKGLIKNSYGTIFNFNTSNATERTICVNGSFYGLDDIGTPPLFGSVVGPAFRDKSRAGYLYALDGSGLLNSYVSTQSVFTMLVPNDAQLNASGIFLKSYITGNSLQTMTSEGWTDIGTSAMQNIVNMHTISGAKELKTSGTQICETQAAFNYLYIKDGAITSSALYNRSLQPDFVGNIFYPFNEVTNNGASWSNGKVYEYPESELFEKESSDGLQYTLAVCNDKRFVYNTFVQLMKKAGMISGNSILGFPVLPNRFVMFIPTDAAIKSALAANKIPGITSGTVAVDGSITVTTANLNVNLLRAYLLSYVLNSSFNVIMSYPYPGSAMKSGAYMTSNGLQLNYVDSGTSMSVQLGSGNVVNVSSQYNYFPFAFDDGCFHMIDSVL